MQGPVATYTMLQPAFKNPVIEPNIGALIIRIGFGGYITL